MYEQLYINKHKSVNRINPFNILADLDRKNYLKEYRNENKDKISEYSKQRYINNKEYFDNYVEENREKIKEYKAHHYQKNKDKVAEKAKEKILCKICELEIRKSGYNRHTKSKMHINNLKYKDDIVLD